MISLYVAGLLVEVPMFVMRLSAGRAERYRPDAGGG